MYLNTFRDAAHPRGVGPRFEHQRLMLYDCQMSFLFISESQALQWLGSRAANASTDLLHHLHDQENFLIAAANATLWDAGSGVYRQVDASADRKGFSPSISPTSFYGMIGGVPSMLQAEQMVRRHLTNSSEFCVDAGPAFTPKGATVCPYALPSISRSDPNFWDNSYWRGRIWGPLNLLTWIGLSHPKYDSSARITAARRGLCKQSLSLLMVEWRAHRHVHENYNATLGIGGDKPNSNPFYHWGANLGYIAMREAMRV